MVKFGGTMKRILICDDQVEIREALGMLVELEFEADIVFAKDGVECIDRMTIDSAFDLIICDFNMPRANGDAVYDHNLKGHKSPFIFLSGDDCRRKVNPEKLTFFIPKPWPDGVLVETIKSVFEKGDAA